MFAFVEKPGLFEEPDRLRWDIDRRPGETMYVIARGRYCGVARWSDSESRWVLPELDYATWRALGKGRSASRRLPDGAIERAREVVDALLEAHPAGSVVERDGKRVRIVGRSAEGGVRVDGGEGAFKERTVSLTDIAWVLVARDDVDREGGVLDEARVNRVRYLEGTPKEATRWIDTGHAMALVRVG